MPIISELRKSFRIYLKQNFINFGQFRHCEMWILILILIFNFLILILIFFHLFRFRYLILHESRRVFYKLIQKLN